MSRNGEREQPEPVCTWLLQQRTREPAGLVSYGGNLERRRAEIFGDLRKPLGHEGQTHDAA